MGFLLVRRTSGPDVFSDAFNYSTGGRAGNSESAFQAAGWDNVKAINCGDSGAGGYLYTVANADLPSGITGALPGSSGYSLAIEALPVTSGAQTDFYLQLGNSSVAADRFPAQLWIDYYECIVDSGNVPFLGGSAFNSTFGFDDKLFYFNTDANYGANDNVCTPPVKLGIMLIRGRYANEAQHLTDAYDGDPGTGTPTCPNDSYFPGAQGPLVARTGGPAPNCQDWNQNYIDALDASDRHVLYCNARPTGSTQTARKQPLKMQWNRIRWGVNLSGASGSLVCKIKYPSDSSWTDLMNWNSGVTERNHEWPLDGLSPAAVRTHRVVRIPTTCNADDGAGDSLVLWRHLQMASSESLLNP